NEKALHVGGLERNARSEQQLLLAAGALELRGELLDAARRIDEALFTGVGRMRVHRHVAEHHEIVFAVDLLLTDGLHGRLREKTTTGGNVEEANVVKSWVAFRLHGYKLLSLT